jgi:dissimilatory sulfite reductase (desulfoviridin) alpha/beta subunit
MKREWNKCCGLCVEVCSGKAIKLVEEKPVIDKESALLEINVYLSALDALKIKRSGWDLFVGGKWEEDHNWGLNYMSF